MAHKFTKLNYRFGLIEFPVTLSEMEAISLEFPKTERKFYEFALTALKKVMKPGEKIYSFNSADPSLLKNGFIVVADSNLILVSLKGGMFGGAETELIKYQDIKSVDFDIAPDPIGLAQMELGILLLETKGMLGNKKRTIRNIPKHNLDSVVRTIRTQIQKYL